jgi:hypothetical protein
MYGIELFLNHKQFMKKLLESNEKAHFSLLDRRELVFFQNVINLTTIYLPLLFQRRKWSQSSILPKHGYGEFIII